MQRRIVRALCAIFLLCSALPLAVFADDRTITQPGSIPSSTQTNQQTRDDRTALGIFARDVLGAAAQAGTYTNLSVVPNGGLYVAVQPTGTGDGSVYQIGPEDPLPLPQNQATQLSTDTNPIVIHGIQNGPTGGIGPMAAPTSGNSVIYLLEAQTSTIDGPNQTVLFQNVTGGTNTESLPVERTDKLSYQVISGAAASSPTAPAITSGWVAIATIRIPSGTSAITSAMITPAAPFGGFIASGGSPTVSGLTISSAAAGCLQTSSSGVVSSLPCTSGLGSVAAGFPITTSTSGSVASVGCPTCVTSVLAGANLTSSGGTTPTIGLSHGNYDDLANTQTITAQKTYSQYIVAPGLVSSSGVQLSDDSASVHGLNVIVSRNATYGTRYYDGNPASGGSVSAQIDAVGNYTLQPPSSTACISLNVGEIPGCPTISNSSDGGMNFSTLAASSLGYRWFKIATNSALTQTMSLDPFGNLSILGSLSVPGNVGINGSTALNGVYNTIGTSANNGVLSVPGSGTLYLNLPSGGPVVIGNGAGASSDTQFNTNGSATIGGALNAVGPISALNGQSVPFDAIVANQANEHFEHGIIMDVGGGGGVYNIGFVTAYAAQPTCILTPGSYSGSSPTTGLLIVSAYIGSGSYTGFTAKNNTNAAVNVNYLCIGY